ncbi:nose resistant to fluoxetine protein 6-like [Zerene cesonia]|uniref:nose resistant to fluoxetine protein 6-like n=1 Tax=Zerene cesonia TaxID=33412 RepID=UPI0018E5313B|nr:nose resistant to fluoxetine protein 6-like [Zerene cesonia]
MDVLQINPQNVFDTELYERVLDPKECQKQLSYLSNSSLVLQFLDASAKIPSGLLSLNLADYGDYYECLAIDHSVHDMHIQGKFCVINIPFTQKSSKLNMYWKSQMPKFTTNDILDLLPEQLVIYFRSLFQNVENSPVVKDIAEDISRIYTSFSIYTNTRRLVNFQTHKYALECVDGIRTLSMLWVLCGHTYIFTFMSPPHNMSYVIQWTSYFTSTWISACPIVVDTFFALSGILCIYVIPDNITTKQFVKFIPVFYLYRILRMLPLLATIVLFQSSIMIWISDGPDWDKMAMATEFCRQRWWTTLLHIQNYYRPLALCVFQSWYIAVDTQLYLLSPFIIVFLLGSSLVAWITLTTVGYCESFANFFQDFYLNTATRASPFVMGILFGYVLKQRRGKRIEIPMVSKYAIALWITAFASMAYCVFAIYETVQIPYEFSWFDAILNSVMRGLWGTSICWMVLACVHGYGGPINWFLSLPLWKLPARLSYAVYLSHLQILQIMKSSTVKLQYFTELEMVYEIAVRLRPEKKPQDSAAKDEDFSSEDKSR